MQLLPNYWLKVFVDFVADGVAAFKLRGEVTTRCTDWSSTSLICRLSAKIMQWVGTSNHSRTYNSSGGEFAELRSYILVRCLWNPDGDWKKEMEELLAAY